MRFAALLTLISALTLVACSRQPPEEPSPLGVLIPATLQPTGPHPDLKLKYEEFAAKHFPNEWKDYVDIQTQTAELDTKATAALMGGRNPESTAEARKYREELAPLITQSCERHEKLAKMVSERKETMKDRGNP